MKVDFLSVGIVDVEDVLREIRFKLRFTNLFVCLL
jgi:hypothetical protein